MVATQTNRYSTNISQISCQTGERGTDSHPWEQRQLGEVGEIHNGRDYKHLQPGNIPVYGTSGYMLSVDDALSWNDDAVGIGRKGTIDKPCILRAPFWTVDTLFFVTPRSSTPLEFLFTLFESVNWKSKDESTGVPSLTKQAIVNTAVKVPDTSEQHQIGVFFSTLDNLIAAAERQEDLLKQKKQAYLQLMFPQEGETEPRLRFAGFSGEWQQKMVGDLVGKTFGGGTPSTSNSEYWIGRLPWIQSSNLADGQIFRVDVEKHISDIALQHSSAQLIPAGSIAVVTHVGVGKLALVPFEYSTSQDFISLGDLKCDSRFLSLALQERLRKDLRVVQGSTIKGITKQDLLHKKLTLPKQRDEQARIATFLMLFGKTIAQINERKALLQRMKEAYLQRLFL